MITSGNSFARRLIHLGLVAVLLGTSILACGCWSDDARSNLILITLDTFRPDHLGVEGHETALTPNLDEFARSGVMYTRCLVPVPITLPSHTSILTGTSPLVHGVHDNAGYKVKDENLTLAEILHDHGFATAAFISGIPLVRANGLNQGFETYDDHLGVTEGLWWNESNPGQQLQMDERKADETTSAVITWLHKKKKQPFFAWVHYFDAHQGYDPPPPYNDVFYEQPYDGEIAFIDEQIGRLLKTLDEQGLRENTSIVITGDHAEGLNDHGELTHSMLTYNSTLRVPLLAQFVGFDGEKICNDPVSVLDIVPTVLDYFAIEFPTKIDGRSLLPWLRNEHFESTPLYFETEAGRNAFGWALIEGIRDGQWKLIKSVRDELFDIEADPDETTNLIQDKPEVAAKLKEKLLAIKNHSLENAVSREQNPTEVAADVRQQLAALGYLVANPINDEDLATERAATHPIDHIDVINDWSQVRAAVTAQEYDLAEDLLSSLLSYDSKNIDFLDLQSYVLLRTNRLTEAKTILEELMEIQPDNPRVLFSLSFIYSSEDKNTQSLELLDLCIQLDPAKRAKYLISQSAVNKKIGNLDAAIQNLTSAAEISPNDGETCRQLATLFRQRNDLETSEAWLEEAVRRNPFDARVRQNLAAMYLDTHRLEDALQVAEECVRLWPDYPQGIYTLAQARVSLGDMDGAVILLEDLAKKYPSSETGSLARQALRSITATDPG